MQIENKEKSSNFLRIVFVLQSLRDEGIITVPEYYKAKTYYKNITGADIIVLN